MVQGRPRSRRHGGSVLHRRPATRDWMTCHAPWESAPRSRLQPYPAVPGRAAFANVAHGGGGGVDSAEFPRIASCSPAAVISATAGIPECARPRLDACLRRHDGGWVTVRVSARDKTGSAASETFWVVPACGGDESTLVFAAQGLL